MSRDSLDDVRADRYGGESVGSMQVVLGSVVAMVLYLALSWAVIHLPVLSTTPLRFFVVIPLLLFLPGYAFLSALFPGRQSVCADSNSGRAEQGRDGACRSRKIRSGETHDESASERPAVSHQYQKSTVTPGRRNSRTSSLNSCRAATLDRLRL